MEKIIDDGKQPDQSEPGGDRKNWIKPVLIQLDVKQTQVVDCPSGTHWDPDARDCLP